MGKEVNEVRLKVGAEDDSFFKEAGAAKINFMTQSATWNLPTKSMKLGDTELAGMGRGKIMF